MVQVQGTYDAKKWHAGEVFMQEKVMGPRAAEAHRALVGGFVRDFMPEQHSEFYESQPWLVAASLDADGWPRASILQRPMSHPLFFTVDGGKGFRLHPMGAMRGDLFLSNVCRPGAPVGLLGIDLVARRRNRVNGRVDANEGSINVSEVLSFGNCPKYITSRPMTLRSADALEPFSVTTVAASTEEGALPTEAIMGMADTFFIASGNDAVGVDASHRGGPAGFVRVSEDGRRLTIPDYTGNGHHNTNGNIALEPRVGLIVVEFDAGRVHQIQGRAEVQLAKDPSLPGADRVLTIDVHSITSTTGALFWAFGDGQPSPFNPPLDPQAGDPVKVVGVKTETHDARTLLLSAPRPIRYLPGQYATFRLSRPGTAEVFTRAWTLSSTPRNNPFGEDHFAVTVKRKDRGAVSPLLHDDAALAELEWRLVGVEGEFTLPEPFSTSSGGKPLLVFAAAGSGVTPVISVLRRLHETGDFQAAVIYACKRPEDVIFHAELRELASADIRIGVALTQVPEDAAEILSPEAEHYHRFAGRPSAAMVDALLPPGAVAHRAYVCGPGTFADAATALLAGRMHPDGRVVSESFDY